MILFHFFAGAQRRKLRMVVCLAIMLIISPDDMVKGQRIKASGWPGKNKTKQTEANIEQPETRKLKSETKKQTLYFVFAGKNYRIA